MVTIVIAFPYGFSGRIGDVGQISTAPVLIKISNSLIVIQLKWCVYELARTDVDCYILCQIQPTFHAYFTSYYGYYGDVSMSVCLS